MRATDSVNPKGRRQGCTDWESQPIGGFRPRLRLSLAKCEERIPASALAGRAIRRFGPATGACGSVGLRRIGGSVSFRPARSGRARGRRSRPFRPGGVRRRPAARAFTGSIRRVRYLPLPGLNEGEDFLLTNRKAFAADHRCSRDGLLISPVARRAVRRSQRAMSTSITLRARSAPTPPVEIDAGADRRSPS